jgi:hypothetical protein
MIPGDDFDRVRGGDIAEDIAAQIDRRQVLDRPVVVAAFVGRAVIGGCADAFAGSLVDAVNVDALGRLVGKWMSGREVK